MNWRKSGYEIGAESRPLTLTCCSIHHWIPTPSNIFHAILSNLCRLALTLSPRQITMVSNNSNRNFSYRVASLTLTFIHFCPHLYYAVHYIAKIFLQKMPSCEIFGAKYVP